MFESYFILGMCAQFNIYLMINIIHHINGIKNRNSMIISVDGGKASNIVQYTFMIKVPKKSGIEETACSTYKQWSFVQWKEK